MNETLKEWTVQYLKHKDIIAKRILSIDSFDDHLVIKERNGVKKVLFLPVLNSLKVNPKENIIVVTFNTAENFKSLIAQWNSIKEYPTLSIIFINPLSQTEHKWIIYPRTHSRIADEESLKSGLKALYDTVDSVSPATLKKLQQQNATHSMKGD